MQMQTLGYSGDTLEFKLHWILRMAAGLCFIGHGAFGVLTKAEWLPFFQVAYMGPETAYCFMPIIGTVDILMGIWILIKPYRITAIFMVLWAAWTAMLRPLANLGGWEFLERAGNYGVPLALLILGSTYADMNVRGIFKPLFLRPLIPELKKVMKTVLQWTTVLLLIGHGGFGAFTHKANLVVHWESVGLPGSFMDPVLFITLIGFFEIVLGLSVLIKPMRPVLLFIVFWKMATELLYPISGTAVWEFIERFGSYGAPLGLFVLTSKKYQQGKG